MWEKWSRGHEFVRDLALLALDRIDGSLYRPFWANLGAQPASQAVLLLDAERLARLDAVRRARFGAGSAPDAPLGFDDQLVVVIGDATARAHVGALHARCVAIAHNSATTLMNRNVGALKLFEQTEEIRHVSHDFTLSRLPPCTAQYNHFRRLTREKTRLTPSTGLPIMWPWGVRRHADRVRSGHCLQKWEPQG